MIMIECPLTMIMYHSSQEQKICMLNCAWYDNKIERCGIIADLNRVTHAIEGILTYLKYFEYKEK